MYGLDDVFERMTPARVRVAAGLAALLSEPEIAEELGITYAGVRSIVRQLKEVTGERDVRGIGRFWQLHSEDWLTWCAAQGRVRIREREVPGE